MDILILCRHWLSILILYLEVLASIQQEDALSNDTISQFNSTEFQEYTSKDVIEPNFRTDYISDENNDKDVITENQISSTEANSKYISTIQDYTNKVHPNVTTQLRFWKIKQKIRDLKIIIDNHKMQTNSTFCENRLCNNSSGKRRRWNATSETPEEFNNSTTLIPTIENLSFEQEVSLPTVGEAEEIDSECPPNYTPFRSENKTLCYYLTEAHSSLTSCSGALNYHHTLEKSGIINQSVWVPPQNETCLINNDGNVIMAQCGNKHPSACVSTYEYFTDSSDDPLPRLDAYCKRLYNDTCVGDDFQSRCFCRSNHKVQNQSLFCNKLATLETTAIIKLIVRTIQNTPCWINSYRKQNTNNSTQELSYTTLNSNGFEERTDEMSCGICDIPIIRFPSVHLRLQKNSDYIELTVINAREVNNYITCFQDYLLATKIDIVSNKLQIYMHKFKFPSKVSQYQCTAVQFPYLNTVYSNIIYFSLGHTYVLRMTIFSPTIPHDTSCNYIYSYVSDFVEELHFIKSTPNVDQSITVFCNLTTQTSDKSVAEEYQLLKKLLNRFNNSSGSSKETTVFEAPSTTAFKNSTRIRVDHFTSSEVCLPSITTTENRTLRWPETPIGVTVTPQELCVQMNGYPVTRTCTGSFILGSEWSEVNGTCKDITYSPRTVQLNELLQNEVDPGKINKNLFNITENRTNFDVLQVHLISKLMTKFVKYVNTTPDIDTTIKVMNNLMHLEHSTLKLAQETLNSTDILLHNLDRFLGKTLIPNTSVVTEKLLVQISDLKSSNIIGLKLENVNASLATAKLNSLVTPKDIESNNDFAILLPEKLRDTILNCAGSKAPVTRLITTVFYDDVLFNENSTDRADNVVVGVFIPEFDCTFDTPVKIMFKPSNLSTKMKCASWEYGYNEFQNIRGRWLIESDFIPIDSTHVICEFNHMTHFTLLVLTGNTHIDETHKKALDIITAVGSSLSLIGLVAIFITAIMFKTFRSNNAIVIHFSVAMTLQVIFLFIADTVAGKALCITFGALLHYIVLVQFCWMLVIAILQYRRYVIIFANPASHLVIKSSLFAWGLPLIPILITMSISINNYGKNYYGICYALGNYFIFGLLLPVSLILLANLLLFLRIMLSVASARHIKSHRKNDDTSTLQLKLAVMLYFLLGMTWGFGLLAAAGAGIIYSYVFCITATLQGFILFLYFIILNEKTRKMCIGKWICCSKSNNYDMDESAATAMVRRQRTTLSSDTTQSRTQSTTSEMLKKYKNRKSVDFQ